MSQSTSLEKRFWAKVDKSGDCWLWTAAKNPLGYGVFNWDGPMRLAHRVAYELTVAPIPSWLEPDHLCRTPACVNSAHLELVTHRENVLRGTAPTAVNAAKTHCDRGHELSGENLTHPRKGRPERRCRECHNFRERERHRRAVIKP